MTSRSFDVELGWLQLNMSDELATVNSTESFSAEFSYDRGRAMKLSAFDGG